MADTNDAYTLIEPIYASIHFYGSTILVVYYWIKNLQMTARVKLFDRRYSTAAAFTEAEARNSV